MTDTIRIAGADDVPALYALLQDAYAPLVPQGVHFNIIRSPIEHVAQTVARETTFVLERADADGRRAPAATLTVRFPWVSGERPARRIRSCTGSRWRPRSSGRGSASHCSATWKRSS